MSKGDSIYFRVNSIDDGRYDAVQFDPTIAYTGVDNTQVDEKGMSAYASTPVRTTHTAACRWTWWPPSPARPPFRVPW